jgi:hypothetical protein
VILTVNVIRVGSPASARGRAAFRGGSALEPDHVHGDPDRTSGASCSRPGDPGLRVVVAALAVAVALLSAGCAAREHPGRVPIRPGSENGDAAFLPLDARAPDAAPPDASPPDAAPPPSPPRRGLLVRVRAEAWADGVRARLEPPQAAVAADPLAALPAAGLLVEWSGPDSPGTALLERLVARPDRPFTALYDLHGRRADDLPAQAVADVSWLAARLADSPGLLRIGGRPVFGARAGPDEQAAFAAARARLASLPGGVGWLVEVDVAGDPAPPADAVAVLPAAAYGWALDGERATDAEADARQLHRWRRAMLDAGVTWLPRARPPRNPRLAFAAGVVEPPDVAAFERSLALARRDVSPDAPLVVADGWGGWSDDTQLDPVVAGAPTDAPDALTAGLAYAPYGTGRIEAAAALLRPAGAPPADLARPPALLELVRGDGIAVRRLERTADQVRLALDGDGRYEVLLDGRPWIVPDGARLRYERTTGDVYVDLVFEDGARLYDHAPPPSGTGAIEVSLAAFAGRRVDEATLVRAGGGRAVDAELGRLRVSR